MEVYVFNNPLSDAMLLGRFVYLSNRNSCFLMGSYDQL